MEFRNQKALLRNLLSLWAFRFAAGLGAFAASMSAGGPPGPALEHATDILNPRVDSSAVLVVTEWENGKVARQSSYRAYFQGQDVLLLRKTAPEKDRGRSILMRKNSMWIELPSARRPLHLSAEQRLTSEASIADLARANFMRDYKVERIAEELVPEQLQHFFLHAIRKDVPYSDVELWVEKGTGKPKRAKFVSAARALSKNCEYDSYREVMGMERPVRFSCSEAGRANWKVELLFRNWTEARMDTRFLDPGALGKEESVMLTPNEVRTPGGKSNRISDDMVLVPEGKFVMGRDNGFPDEQPAHEASTRAFWIDRTEVTVAQYKRFLKAKRLKTPSPPTSPSMPRVYFVDGMYGKFPMVDVSWQAAHAYCHWAGKRLPTEVEWEKAARGTDQRLYPWGSMWDEDKVNSRETPYSSVAGRKVHFTSEVGNCAANASPYGALDMAGNAWEWVADWYTPYPGNNSRNDAYGQRYRVIRGGSWVSNSLALTTVARDYSDPTFGYDSIGFRCAKDEK